MTVVHYAVLPIFRSSSQWFWRRYTKDWSYSTWRLTEMPHPANSPTKLSWSGVFRTASVSLHTHPLHQFCISWPFLCTPILSTQCVWTLRYLQPSLTIGSVCLSWLLGKLYRKNPSKINLDVVLAGFLVKIGKTYRANNRASLDLLWVMSLRKHLNDCCEIESLPRWHVHDLYFVCASNGERLRIHFFPPALIVFLNIWRMELPMSGLVYRLYWRGAHIRDSSKTGPFQIPWFAVLGH